MTHDNWLFVVFAGIALLFQLLARGTAKAKKDSSETPRRSTSSPPPVPEPIRVDSQTEQIRKFLEALGRPETSTPPPVVRPRTDVAPRPIGPVQPPKMFMPTSRKEKTPRPVDPADDPLRRVDAPRAASIPLAPRKPSAPTSPRPAISPSSQVAEFVRRDDQIDIATLLRSPNGLRDAVILREIFGPPRSLQDVDLVGIA